MIHELKTHPAYFERLLDGSKTFELRRDDRGYQPGDVLILREWDPAKDHECDRPSCSGNRWTGRALRKRVGFIAKGTLFGHELGEYAVLSLLAERATEEAP